MKLSDHVIEAAKSFGTATLHEAYNKRGNLPSAIKPVHPGMRVCGRAFTVQSPPRDNLWLHRAIYAAEPGDILVVDVSGEYEAGYWGEIMSCAAIQRKLGGLVINGCVRDADLLEKMGFPVFARGLCIRGTGKDPKAYGALNQPLRIGEAVVYPGDLIAGDRDGVVVIAREDAEATVARAELREQSEAQIIKRIQQGETTLEIYNFPG